MKIPAALCKLLLLSWLLAGCGQGQPPAASWENAVQGLYTATLSPDGRFGLIGSINHGGSLWDMPEQERLFNWNHRQGEYTALVATAISPDAAYGATASERTIVLWAIATGEPHWFWTTPGDVLDMKLTVNGDYALLGLDNHTAVLFDIKNGGIRRSFRHDNKVRSVALSDDARFALTGSDDRTARLWNLQSGELLHSWPHDNQLVKTALSADGRYAFTAAQADLAAVWDTQSGRELMRMPLGANNYIPSASYTAAAFSADGQQLLTGTNGQLVQLWEVASGSELRRWRVPKKAKWKPSAATVMAVSFGPRDGQYYAIASNGLSHRLD